MPPWVVEPGVLCPIGGDGQSEPVVAGPAPLLPPAQGGVHLVPQAARAGLVHLRPRLPVAEHGAGPGAVGQTVEPHRAGTVALGCGVVPAVSYAQAHNEGCRVEPLAEEFRLRNRCDGPVRAGDAVRHIRLVTGEGEALGAELHELHRAREASNGGPAVLADDEAGHGVLIAVVRAPGREDQPARPDLAEPGGRDLARSGRRDEPVVRGARLVAEHAVLGQHQQGQSEAAQALACGGGDGRIDLDAHDVVPPQPVGQQGGVPAGAGADLQRPVPGLDVEVAQHAEDHGRAWMSSDLGQLREADAQGRTAWLCAELSGHNDLRAWALSTRSKVAFWDGRLRDAITFARRGAAYSPSGTVGVLLACQEADAWSQLGAEEEALAVLARAEDARDASTGEDQIGGIFACQPARQENYAAAVQLRIGRPAEALRSADNALTLLLVQPVRAYGTEAQIHISQAAAHLAIGEAEGALEALAPVLALPPDHRLAPVTRRLHELSATIGRPHDSGTAAVGLCSAIEEFCLDSAPRHLALSPGHATS